MTALDVILRELFLFCRPKQLDCSYVKKAYWVPTERTSDYVQSAFKSLQKLCVIPQNPKKGVCALWKKWCSNNDFSLFYRFISLLQSINIDDSIIYVRLDSFYEHAINFCLTFTQAIIGTNSLITCWQL